MVGHWFTGSVGITTFAAALGTIAGAALVARHVCRRYASRPSVLLALGVLAGSLVLPWLSYRAEASAAAPHRSRIPTASTGTFLRELDAGKVQRLATAAADVDVPASSTVFETAGGHWRQADVPAGRLSARERAVETKLEVATLPVPVQDQLGTARNAALVAFLGVDVLAVVMGALAVATVVDRPRRVDLDRAFAQLLAEHHGRETV